MKPTPDSLLDLCVKTLGNPVVLVYKNIPPVKGEEVNRFFGGRVSRRLRYVAPTGRTRWDVLLDAIQIQWPGWLTESQIAGTVNCVPWDMEFSEPPGNTGELKENGNG